MQQLAPHQTTVQNRRNAPRAVGSVSGTFMALMAAIMVVAACGRAPADSLPASDPEQTPSQNASQPVGSAGASSRLEPASGYGGLYVQVSGEGWPQNMLVMVTIEDAQGRSETLAAADTDQQGKLATGFLFPIDQRWLAADAVTVVSTSADGRVESKVPFQVVAPGAEIAEAVESETGEAEAESVATGDAPDSDSDDTIALASNEDEAEYTVILPLVASTGPAVRASGRAARNANPRTTESGAIQVEVTVDPSGSQHIDCRDDHAWLTVAIYSSGSFDATRIDPGSVTVAGGADLGYGADGAADTLTFAAYPARRQATPATASRQAYQWRWHLDDVDGDGSTDMVLEFRLDYTELECNATVVSVRGRTKDGTNFEGSQRGDLLVLERS